MALLDQYDLAFGDADFAKTVHMAVVKAAVAIQAENATTDKHTERSQLAFEVLRGTFDWKLFLPAVTSNASITSVKDGDIEFQVAAVWNAFAMGRL